MKSIQAKLTITILVIFLVAMSVLGGLNYWKARDTITQNITDEMTKQAVNLAQDVGDWLEARKSEMTMLASNPAMAGGNPEAIMPILTTAKNANPAYDDLGFADAVGTLWTSTGAKLSVADREYFKAAMQGNVYVSDPVVSKATGHLVTNVAIPVKSAGRVVGILIGPVDMAAISGKVISLKIGQTGYAFVNQKDGTTIIHPSKEVAMKNNSLTDANADPGRKALTQRMVTGEKGLVTLTALGIDRYYAYAPVPGMSWSLAVTVPVAEVSGAVSSLTIISLVTIVVVLILAGIIIAWFARRIARPIKELEAAANRIADGDISRSDLNIRSNDEIGRLGKSFETMTVNLRGLIQKILGATDQVAASSEELTASSEQAAQAANQIAASITTVAAGAEAQLTAAGDASSVVEEMSAGIEQIAASAQEVAAQSSSAAGKAKQGDKEVADAITQMEKIENTVNTSAKVVAKLGERSKEIGLIVDTISGIAGQTNLLALNAAIEAARAGEAGQGFAVVAEEVRKLAEQSQDAAKKIAELIGEIQGETEKAVVAMDDGTREVKTGTEVVQKAGAAFREIADMVTEVSGQVKEISASIQQMATGSQQIVGAVQKIDDLGKKSAGEAQGVSAAAEEQLASMEEIASSSQSLAKLAQDLQTAVATFRL